jgi:hypothetical protein
VQLSAKPVEKLEEKEIQMADNNGNFAASPYPVYNFGGGDDDSVQHAILTSHGNASVERNQDSQFAALRSQHLNRDVISVGKDARAESLQTKYDLAVQSKDSEIRQSERLAEISAKLDSLRAEQLGRDLADAKNAAFEARTAASNSQLVNMLEKILAKLPV